MNKVEFFGIVQYIVSQGKKIAYKYSRENNLQIEFVDIFAQTDEEKDELLDIVQKLGKVIERPKTGITFLLNKPFVTKSGTLKLVKVRFPDPTRPQKGAPDFRVPNYQEFKKKILGKENVNLIERPKYEMIEIWDNNEDVLVYIPSILLSDNLNLNNSQVK